MTYQNRFPLFQSHLDLAHQLWRNILTDGDWAIDATCGNGKDTLALARMIDGGLIALDIQQEAIDRTQKLLDLELNDEQRKRVYLYLQSHETFPDLAYQHKIKLIVYNLGYLPRGNKQFTTQKATTLVSVQASLGLLTAGGLISITCYPGHKEGAEEEALLLEWSKSLDPQVFNVSHIRLNNRVQAPSLLLIQRTLN